MRSGQNNLSNPSQDSAIGSFSSITDGELSRASSFKCQSMSSPIGRVAATTQITN
jgi:hypothetical protein